jgi:hypothetical protein
MPSDEDLLYAVNQMAEASIAQTDLLADIIGILVPHLDVDRQRLLEEIDRLYAPVNSTEIYQAAYNNARTRLLQRLREKP